VNIPWLNALWTKAEASPPWFVILHRFLASQQQLARACKYIALQVHDNELVYAIWQKALPKAKGIPQGTSYVAARSEETEKLVERIAQVWAYNKREAQEAYALCEAAGSTAALKAYLGFDG